MAFNTKSIIKDANAKPAPQYYNPTTDVYEVLEGANGANKVMLYNDAGQAIDLASLISTVLSIYNKDKTKIHYDLSTVAKPIEGNIKGDKFFEIDTGIVKMWNGSSWVVI